MIREILQILEADLEFEFTIEKTYWDEIEAIQDYLKKNYKAGSDYKIYIERGDEIANGLDLKSSKAKKDQTLLGMLDDIPNQDDD